MAECEGKVRNPPLIDRAPLKRLSLGVCVAEKICQTYRFQSQQILT